MDQDQETVKPTIDPHSQDSPLVESNIPDSDTEELTPLISEKSINYNVNNDNINYNNTEESQNLIYDTDTKTNDFNEYVKTDKSNYTVSTAAGQATTTTTAKTNVAKCSIEIRHLFIRKVYTLVSLQLLFTLISGFIISVNDPVKQFCINNIWLIKVSSIGSMVFLGLAYWKPRSYSWNLLSLVGFTLCESYLVGLGSAIRDSQVVIEAVLITMFVFIGLTAFSFQTNYDFTQWQSRAVGALFFLIGLGFFGMFISKSNGLFELVHGIIGAIIFLIFIAIDTQRIMRRYHPEEEVPATIALYVDILNLFIKVLDVANNRENKKKKKSSKIA
ncbi:hypothetical protein BVG19_g762 [[Candida] boidinii]|nr:hypothetical protein BVG19_g762 [[Candida] boidinii]OWB50774.1 hypothetical protein B5S27_g2327 [[Candida] boidinii]